MSTSTPRPSTVQSKATPGVGYTRRTGPMGASGESPPPPPPPGASPPPPRPGCRPARRAPSWPARRPGRGARRARRRRAQLAADQLQGDEERGQSGDPTEHAEGDGLGP